MNPDGKPKPDDIGFEDEPEIIPPEEEIGFEDEEEILPPDEEKGGWEKVKDVIRTNRRKFIMGSLAAVALYSSYLGGREIVRTSQTETGRGMRCKETFEEIKSMQNELDEAQRDFIVSPAEALLSPGAYTRKLMGLKTKVDALRGSLAKVVLEDVKVNSGFVYLQQKKVQAAQALFLEEPYKTIFECLNIYNDVVNKVNKGKAAVKKWASWTISHIPDVDPFGVPVGGMVKQFLRGKTDEHTGPWSGNVPVFGVTVPLAALRLLAGAAQELIVALNALQEELSAVGDPTLEISNNWVIRAGMESPRATFTRAFSELRDIYTAHRPDEQYDEDEMKKIREFLVEYGYLTVMGKKGRKDAILDSDVKKVFKHFRDIYANAVKFAAKFDELSKKGSKSPIAGNGKEAGEVQDLLALAGYLGLADLDKFYGKKTYEAAKQWEADWPRYEK